MHTLSRHRHNETQSRHKARPLHSRHDYSVGPVPTWEARFTTFSYAPFGTRSVRSSETPGPVSYDDTYFHTFEARILSNATQTALYRKYIYVRHALLRSSTRSAAATQSRRKRPWQGKHSLPLCAAKREANQ